MNLLPINSYIPVLILLSIASKSSLASIDAPNILEGSCFDMIDSSNSSRLTFAPLLKLKQRVNMVAGIAIPVPEFDIAGGIGGNLAAKPAIDG
jgi:hypothetical protein